MRRLPTTGQPSICFRAHQPNLLNDNPNHLNRRGRKLERSREKRRQRWRLYSRLV
jgi:hypothetical protein